MLTTTFQYAYDSVGNRTAQTATITSTQVTNYVYDAANRLIEVDGAPYTWDDNGNLVSDGEKTYTYNQANRLTELTDGTTTYQFSYNGDGARLRQVAAGVPTTYTQDLAAPLPVVLQSKTGANATRYVYALGTRPLAQNDTAWEYLLADALGSVRQIVDTSGNVTLAESYEPYGTVLTSTGTASSIFGYSGEQIDTSGLIYLRARYMQPTLGIFLARDPWNGQADRPITLNGYNYGEQNPVLLTDASGKCPICWIIIALLFGGCASSGDSCPVALPTDLQQGPLGNMPRAQAISEIQKLYNIQLPPGFHFEYEPTGPIGFNAQALWFNDPKFGEVAVYELAFRAYALNSYGATSSAHDIADIMVHEAVHAWQIYSIKVLADKPDLKFKTANTDYTTVAWVRRYKKMLEWEAYSYVEEHTPPLCPSEALKSNDLSIKNQNLGPYPKIEGVPNPDRIDLLGHPLP